MLAHLIILLFIEFYALFYIRVYYYYVLIFLAL
jgi:hypothetical protein